MRFLDIEEIVEVSVVGIGDPGDERTGKEVIRRDCRLGRITPVRHVVRLADGAVLIVVTAAGVVTVERKALRDVDADVAAERQVLVVGSTGLFADQPAVTVTEQEAGTRSGTGIRIGAVRVLRTAVGITEREESRETHGVVQKTHHTVTCLITIRIFVHLLDEHDFRTDVEPLLHLRVGRQIHVVALDIVHLCSFQVAVALREAQADVVVGLAGIAGNVQVVRLGERGLEDFLVRIGDPIIIRCSVEDFPVLSVGVRRVAQVALVAVEPACDAVADGIVVHTEGLDAAAVDVHLRGDTLLELCHDAFLVRNVVRKTDRLVPGEVVGIGDRHFVLDSRTVLGGDQDHTPCSTATVDGGRSGVLQDGDALDVVRVDEGEVGDFHAVEEDQRLVVTVDGTHTTDLHRRGCRQVVGVVRDRQARDDTLETFGHIGDRLAAECLVSVDSRDGTRQVDLLLGTETDNHRFGEHLGIICEDDVDHTPAGYSDLLGLVTDAGKLERAVRRNVDGICAVNAGRCSGGCAENNHIGTYDRLIVIVDHLTGNGNVLSQQRSC